MRHNYTDCRYQARGLKGQRDRPRLPASPLGIISEEVAWLFPVKSCRAMRRNFTELWCLLSYLAVGDRNCKFFSQVSYLEQ